VSTFDTLPAGGSDASPAADPDTQRRRNMTAGWARLLLLANLLAQIALLAGALWCIAFPSRRIYPMTGPNGWYYLMWTLFGFIFVSNLAFVVLDWNTGLWPSGLRFWLALPVAFLGAALVTWGMVTLGAKKTSGLADDLVARGPYLVTRNPQYVGDFLLFLGIALFANSEVVAVTHLLTALVLLVAPLAEEPWLEEQYGEAYVEYRRTAPRYL
jgi:protein-S-isoprenylcysteine O-methyltransferase Ste14